MNLSSKVRYVFKGIASLSACVFLWQQVSWAGGVEIINKVNHGNTHSGYVTPNNLQSGQSVAESVVGLKNAIENFSIPPVNNEINNASDVTYTYYSNGRLESETLTAPDSSGNIYYHYINENWNDQGYGRVDKSRRQAALNGEFSHTYAYYRGTNRIQIKKAYSDGNWKKLVATYSYYNNSNNRVESKTLLSPDALGNIYYHYIDETGLTQDCGRYDKTRRRAALNGELSYSYAYYSDGPFRIKIKTAYSDANWKRAVITYSYYNDEMNRLQSKVVIKSGLTTTYYNDETNRIQSQYNPATCALTTYYNDTAGLVQQVDVYSDSSRVTLVSSTTYYNDSPHRVQSMFDAGTGITTTYYNDTTGLVESKTLSVADTEGVIYYHYLNENWNNQGHGRVDKQILGAADSNGAICYTYSYFPSSQQAQFKYCYKDEAATELVVTYEYNPDGELINTIFADSSVYTYYASGRMESKTLVSPDSSGMIYYRYIDENWNNQGYGRVDQSRGLVPLNGNLTYTYMGELVYLGELSYSYSYYDDTAGRLQTKNAYSDSEWTMLVSVYNYYNDPANRIMSKTDALAGTIYTYYNDPVGYMESKSLIYPDLYGTDYYHYINENWNGRGYGRIDKSKMPESFDGESSYSYNYYDAAAGRLQTKNAYSDDNWTTLIGTYNYYNDPINGVMPEATYYSSGRRESVTLFMPDSYGNIYYHYLDEDWNGRGYGRIDKSAGHDPAVGAYSYSYSYGGSSIPQTIRAYSDNSWTNLIDVVTYYTSGSPESITSYSNAFIGLDCGATYVHFIDENWNNRGYGRVDRATASTSQSYDNGPNDYAFYTSSVSYGYSDTTALPATATGDAYINWATPIWTRTITSRSDYPNQDGSYDVSFEMRWYSLSGNPEFTETFESQRLIGVAVYNDNYLDMTSWMANLQQQISSLNTSDENFVSSPDSQQQQVTTLNKYPHNGDPIDLSWFRDFNELATALQEKYGADSQQLQNLSDSIRNLSEFLTRRNPLISINANLSEGITLTGVTPDGALIEISSYSGEPFFSSKTISPLLGVPIGNGSYMQGDIDIKNGSTVEASFTTNTGSIEFNRIIISSDLTQSRVDNGTYTEFSAVILDSKTYNFTGEGAKGYYFGTSCDTINSITGLKTSSEAIVYLATEVITGERAPVTDAETYGKLLYDIYNNGKQSLTTSEANIIQTQTQQIVQDALQNVSGVTQDYINAIASKQCSDIFDIALGIKSYNPPIQ